MYDFFFFFRVLREKQIYMGTHERERERERMKRRVYKKMLSIIRYIICCHGKWIIIR